MEEIKIGDYVMIAYKQNEYKRSFGLVISKEKTRCCDKITLSGFSVTVNSILYGDISVYCNKVYIKIITKDRYNFLFDGYINDVRSKYK